MASCVTCSHPSRKEIERLLKSGIPQGTVSLWTREHGPYVSRLALGRHARAHMGVSSSRGRKPMSADYAEAVVQRAAERMAEGEIEPGIADGLNAQKILDARQQAGQDRDLVARITIAMTNNFGRGLPAPVEGEVYELPDGSTYDPAPYRELQAEFAELLPDD